MDGDDLTPLNPVLRAAQATDADASAACIDAAYAQYVGRISDMPSVSDGCAEDIASNQVWVAVQDDQIVAGLVLVAGDGALIVANLALHPAHGGYVSARTLSELTDCESSRPGVS